MNKMQIFSKLFDQTVINRHSIFPEVDIEKYEIEGKKINSLLKKHGSPLYIFSKRCIEKKYEQLEKYLKTHDLKFSIAYAFKANRLEDIIEVLKKKGSYAEVASPLEYNLAQKLGFKEKKVIINGPFKPRDLLENAIVKGNQINIDNFKELQEIGEIVRGLDKEVYVGLRLKIVEDSRFGFDVSEVTKALDLIKKRKNLRCVGFHFNYGTNFSYYHRFVKLRISFVKKVVTLKRKYNLNLDYINLGGGVPVEENFGQKVINLDKYLKRVLLFIKKKLGTNVEVILEPGRFLVDQSGVLVTKVFNAEKSEGEQKVVVDASWGNLLPSPYRNHKKQLLKVVKEKPEKEKILTSIYGASCREDDMFFKGYLPELNVGDKVVFFNVGAYAIPLSNSFMFPKPAVIMLDNNKILVMK